MTRTPRTSRAISACLLVALAFTGAACGSSGSDDAASTTTAAVDAGASDTETTVAEPSDDEGTDGDDGSTGSGGACVADSDQMSGSSTVVWDDGDVAPEHTMTFGDDGMLEPETLTVPVGERFAIASPAGADLRAVKVGCAGAQTMPGGITAGFVIDAAGSYTIIDEAADDYAGAEVGTVVVE